MNLVNFLLWLVAVVAVVSMWRGLWQLMDLYLWPNNPKKSNWASFLLGLGILAVALAFISQQPSAL